MNDNIEKRVWVDQDSSLYLTTSSHEFQELTAGVYEVNIDGFGRFFLTKIHNSFEFPYKVYGLEDSLVKRILKTYNSANTGNIGVLLNGLKGTGKTVTAKKICNAMNLPVITLGKKIKDCQLFINSIPQDIVVLLDEYEKVFGDSSEMLTIMDGALNSEFRRLFLLTTNNLYIDKNLLERPSRIRYLKTFEHLAPSIIEEIVDDCLVHTKFRDETIKFISNLETITVDIVKAVIQEVNIHEEAPENFKDVFNAKKITGSYNIYLELDNGDFESFIKSAEIGTRPKYTTNEIGRWFEVNGTYIGEITNVLAYNVLEVSPFEASVDKAYRKNMVPETVVIKVSEADVYHYSFGYGDSYGGGNKSNKPASTNKDNILKLADKLKTRHDKMHGGGAVKAEAEDFSFEESDDSESLTPLPMHSSTGLKTSIEAKYRHAEGNTTGSGHASHAEGFPAVASINVSKVRFSESESEG